MLSLGTIEVVGLPAAIEAADVALKAANVELIGYETTDGMGMVAVKVVGQIGAVKAAMAAAEVAAAPDQQGVLGVGDRPPQRPDRTGRLHPSDSRPAGTHARYGPGRADSPAGG